MKKRESPVDWELIEKLYRAGVLSNVQIAEKCGVTEGAIRKKAKKDQWTKDLSAKIKQRTEELVRARQAEAVRGPSTSLTPATEKQTVEANAQAITELVLGHRTDIKNMRTKASDYQIELDECPDELIKRVGILKILTETQKTLIALERQSFGLDDKAEDHGSSDSEAVYSDTELAVRMAYIMGKAKA